MAQSERRSNLDLVPSGSLLLTLPELAPICASTERLSTDCCNVANCPSRYFAWDGARVSVPRTWSVTWRSSHLEMRSRLWLSTRLGNARGRRSRCLKAENKTHASNGPRRYDHWSVDERPPGARKNVRRELLLWGIIRMSDEQTGGTRTRVK
jgi:hypothetical protein